MTRYRLVSGTSPTVYIPTLEGGQRLSACLDSLRRQTIETEVVVADNGPGDGCRDLIEHNFPEVERVGFRRNLGFGPALNRAIQTHGAGPIILLNDDAVAKPDFVANLLELSQSAEMVAAVLVREDDPETIDSTGFVIDQTLSAFDYLSGESVSCLETAPAPTGPTGGAALYDRAAFNRVSGFDERIFLYYEDVDLGLRLRAAGARCLLATEARAEHGYSETLGAGSARKYAMTGWSRGYLLRRYGIISGPRPLASTLARELPVCLGQIAKDHTFAGVGGRLRGWRDGAGLPPRVLPSGSVTQMSLSTSLRRRLKRYAQG